MTEEGLDNANFDLRKLHEITVTRQNDWNSAT